MAKAVLRLATLALVGLWCSQAAADSGIRAFLNSSAAASESQAARRLLLDVAVQLETLSGVTDRKVCGTPLAPLALELQAELSPGARAVLQAELGSLLARPVLDTFYDVPAKPFRIHYTADSVLNGTTDTAADGRPTYVHVAADALVRAWEMLVDTLGYPAPISDDTVGGGTDLYDCYLDTPFGSFIIGFTQAETWFGRIVGTDTIRSATSYQVVHPTMLPFPQVSDPLDLLRITCAHEFFHAIHFTLDLDEKPSWQFGGWWLEGPAVWFEDVAFPDVNDWSNLSFYTDETHRSLTSSQNLADLHPYGGGSMWCFYLAERFGTPDVIRDIWNRCGLVSGDNSLAATDSMLQTLGSSLDAAWHEFARWCMKTGNRWDNSSFLQGADWPKVTPVTSLFDYPRAVHFTDGSDNLDLNIAAGTPITTITAATTPVEGMGFAAVAHLPFPTLRPDSAMTFYVDAAAGLPVAYQGVGLDTTLGSSGVFDTTLSLGDTTLIPDWLNVDTLFLVASSGVHYDPGDTVSDPLASVTAAISAALDSAGTLANSVMFATPFPNPFDTRTEVAVEFQVSLPEAGTVWLDIFNVAGDRVRSMETSGFAWPPAQFAWDGRNDAGQPVASGLYLCKLTVEVSASGQRQEQLFRVGVIR